MKTLTSNAGCMGEGNMSMIITKSTGLVGLCPGVAGDLLTEVEPAPGWNYPGTVPGSDHGTCPGLGPVYGGPGTEVVAYDDDDDEDEDDGSDMFADDEDEEFEGDTDGAGGEDDDFLDDDDEDLDDDLDDDEGNGEDEDDDL